MRMSRSGTLRLFLTSMRTVIPPTVTSEATRTTTASRMPPPDEPESTGSHRVPTLGESRQESVCNPQGIVGSSTNSSPARSRISRGVVCFTRTSASPLAGYWEGHSSRGFLQPPGGAILDMSRKQVNVYQSGLSTRDPMPLASCRVLGSIGLRSITRGQADIVVIKRPYPPSRLMAVGCFINGGSDREAPVGARLV
ncbi:hypothetical protein C8Q76DRAFT_133657 [Earliella scabrosa]|nr:hypothetical protein C8Q76DRAFT_133657 [Earliella scabrosa]